MIADAPQRAIFDESSRYHRFMEYLVDGEPERDRMARTIGSALRARAEQRRQAGADRRRVRGAACGPCSRRMRSPPICVISRPSTAPTATSPRPPSAILWIWLQGDGEDENVARALALHAALRNDFTLQLEQPGFTYFESRDLIDFEDGTANPKDDAARTEAASSPKGRAPVAASRSSCAGCTISTNSRRSTSPSRRR